MDEEDDDTAPTLQQLREELTTCLDRALAAAASIQLQSHLPSPTFLNRLQKLRREIAGGPPRRSHGGYVRQQDDGPMVDIVEWCQQMVQRIQAFQEEYLTSHGDSPDHFPRERTSADWQQELMCFVPSETTDTSVSSDDC